MKPIFDATGKQLPFVICAYLKRECSRVTPNFVLCFMLRTNPLKGYIGKINFNVRKTLTYSSSTCITLMDSLWTGLCFKSIQIQVIAEAEMSIFNLAI